MSEDWNEAAAGGDFRAALRLLGYPDHTHMLPFVEDLSPDERTLMELIAASDIDVYQLSAWALPKRMHSLRRWLFQSDAGVLEREVTFEHDNEELTAPMWRAMLLKKKSGNEFLQSLDLTLGERLEVFADIYFGAYSIKRDGISWGSLGSMTGDHGEWARVTADRLIAGGFGSLSMDFRWAVFLALVRSGGPIEPRWDELLPAGLDPLTSLMFECASAVPDDRRDAALRRAISRLAFADSIVRCGLKVLSRYPSAPVTELVLQHCDRTQGRNQITKPQALERLAKIGERHALVGNILRAYQAGYTIPELKCVSLFRPASVEQLTEIQREQLVESGRGYDGHEYSAEQRLSDDPELEEASFRGYLEIRVFAAPDGTPRYDAFSYAGDSGNIFEHGTLTTVAHVIQGGLQCDDQGLRDAFSLLLRAEPAAPDGQR